MNVFFCPGYLSFYLHNIFFFQVHFVLIDQKDFKNHKSGSIRSPITEQSCRQPSATSAQPGFGLEALVTLLEMGSELSRYNLKDVLYLRVLVDLKQSKLPARLKTLDPRLNSTGFRQADGATYRK